jgi:pyruvate dehydrogenase E2 component (dihydrolipoamide acetyltransferase)
MISRVVLAKLSPTMEEGTVLKWSKSEGDSVKVGDVLAEIETDKANMEMEALGAGVLRKILVPAGAKAPVGSLIAIIAEASEDISAALTEATRTSLSPAAPPVAAVSVAAHAPAPPAAATPPAAAGRIKASPLARAMAKASQIPLPAISGTGPGGRIVKRDVEAYRVPAGRPATEGPTVVAGQEIPLTGMRKLIARRLSESFFSAPHFFVTVEIDMDSSVALRAQLERAENTKVSFNDLVLKACARALGAYPLVNARWAEDRIVTLAEVHIGIAVALPDGLITPVLRNADRKTLLQISAEAKELGARARDRKLRPDEYTGSTFTISNLGMFGVTAFTAIINPPESAILAVGAVRRIPVVDGDVIRAGHRMNVTMSCDHRVIDGALAARFLERVRTLLEAPASLLLA